MTTNTMHRVQLVTQTFYGYGYGWVCLDCPEGSGHGIVYEVEADARLGATAHGIILEDPAYCGHWPELDHSSCPSSVECHAVPTRGTLGPSIVHTWTPSELPARTEDQMVLDIHAHAAGARK